MQDQCSIVGNIPLGFCCPECDFYEEGGACKRLKEKVDEKMKKYKEDIEVAQKFLEKMKISDRDLENFP
ncbi:MAG: hypothetical protein GF311_07415 [Candidatus Lokiarchaeota archaeon]|nr:hypothetical protein [Candidatus Lokiarchaeota archaeon]